MIPALTMSDKETTLNKFSHSSGLNITNCFFIFKCLHNYSRSYGFFGHTVFVLVTCPAPTPLWSEGVGKELERVLNVPNGARGRSPRKFCILIPRFSLKCFKIIQIRAWKVSLMQTSQFNAHDVCSCFMTFTTIKAIIKD